VRRVAVALVHYPVLDRSGGIVTSAITNLDVHDIARSAMTYGVSAYYLVHPIAAQRTLVERIKSHWIDGSGGKRIPDRVAPMKLVRVVPTLEEAVSDHSGDESATVWTTGAGVLPGADILSHAKAGVALQEPGPPVLLVLGTGWGLHESVHQIATNRLAAIQAAGPAGFNHLSVRAAAAILFDRLLGEYSCGKHARL
jgi:hypothetical protein